MNKDTRSTFLIRMPFWGGLFALFSGKFKIAKSISIPIEKIEVKPLSPPSGEIYFMDHIYKGEEKIKRKENKK